MRGRRSLRRWYWRLLRLRGRPISNLFPVMLDDASRCGTSYCVMTRDVPGNASHGSALQASFSAPHSREEE